MSFPLPFPLIELSKSRMEEGSSFHHHHTLSYIWRGGGGDFVVDGGGAGIGRDGSTLEDSSPPHGRVEGTLVFVEGRVNIAEKVPYYVARLGLALLHSSDTESFARATEKGGIR